MLLSNNTDIYVTTLIYIYINKEIILEEYFNKVYLYLPIYKFVKLYLNIIFFNIYYQKVICQIVKLQMFYSFVNMLINTCGTLNF